MEVPWNQHLKQGILSSQAALEISDKLTVVNKLDYLYAIYNDVIVRKWRGFSRMEGQ